MAALRAIIAALLVPALGAGATLAILHVMAAYNGAGLGDVMQACAPNHVTLMLSPECEPVQTHYWVLLLSAATAAAGVGLMLLTFIGGKTELSVFSFRGLIAAPIATAQWLILIGVVFLAQQHWRPELPSLPWIAGAALGGGLLLWALVSVLRLRGDR